jgi:hypothetical protein
MNTATLKLQAFGLAKIPLLFLVRPKVLRLDGARAEVKVPLGWVTKNHLGSMYFGALAIGADCVVAILALQVADQLAKQYPGLKIVPIFKDLKADFLKRAETDVIFVCEEGDKIQTMVLDARKNQQRVTGPIHARAVSAQNPQDVFAEFTLGLSLKASIAD